MLHGDDDQFYGSTQYPKHMSTLSHNSQKNTCVCTIQSAKKSWSTRYQGGYCETRLSSSKTVSLGFHDKKVNIKDWANCSTRGIWKVLSMVFYPSHRFTNRIMFGIILIMVQISLGYYNADTKNIIVNTCTNYILENAKF